MDIKIIFEDEHFIAIDKPSGVIVNRSDSAGKNETIQDWAEKKLPSSPISGESMEFQDRGGIVHRLDKETSGVLLIAKTPVSFENLKDQFKTRRVKKEYIALVHGRITPGTGEINVPTGRLPWNRKRFGVIPSGRESRTGYKVVSEFQRGGDILSLVEVYPYTGRTHQIRVHLKSIGHPVFADPLYAGRKTSREDRKSLQRIFLHAGKLSISHPLSGKKMVLSSDLPAELKDFLASLKTP